MPQFDTAAFFSQLFWLTLTFYGFYLILFQTYLPGLTRILKLRRKKLELASSQGTALEEERTATLGSFEGLFAQSADQSRNLLGQSLEGGSLWGNQRLQQIQNDRLSETHQDYIYLQADLRGQRHLIRSLTQK